MFIISVAEQENLKFLPDAGPSNIRLSDHLRTIVIRQLQNLQEMQHRDLTEQLQI